MWQNGGGHGAPCRGGDCIPDLPPKQVIINQLPSYRHHQASTLQAKTTLLALTLPIMDTPGALTPQQVACTEPVNINSANQGPISILGSALFSRPRIALEENRFLGEYSTE